MSIETREYTEPARQMQCILNDRRRVAWMEKGAHHMSNDLQFDNGNLRAFLKDLIEGKLKVVKGDAS